MTLVINGNYYAGYVTRKINNVKFWLRQKYFNFCEKNITKTFLWNLIEIIILVLSD